MAARKQAGLGRTNAPAVTAHAPAASPRIDLAGAVEAVRRQREEEAAEAFSARHGGKESEFLGTNRSQREQVAPSSAAPRLPDDYVPAIRAEPKVSGLELVEVACLQACPAVTIQNAKYGDTGMTEPALDARSRRHSFRVGTEGVERIVSDATHVHIYGSHGYVRTPHSNVAWDRPA